MAQKDNVAYTSISDIPKIVGDLRTTFEDGKTLPVSFRKLQLKQLAFALDDNIEAINAAFWRDMRKSKYDVALSETEVVKKEIAMAVAHLDSWTSPKAVKKDLAFALNTAKTIPAPRGVVCVISAWNYPVNLLLVPVAGAIAAGCTVIIKPSEVTSSVAKVITEILPRYLDQSCYRVVNGGKDETTALLEQKFDHIFYTGSGTVGRIVYGAAAKHLTPVVLELGGKSPCFVDNASDGFLKIAAKRCMWGKYLNAGQTCIAPDYVVVDRRVKDKFIGHCQTAITEMFGQDPSESNDYCRIITERHFSRMVELIKGTSGKIVVGGQSSASDFYVAPTIVDVSMSDSLMEEEIFGPILPIITVDHVKDGVRYARSKDRPLACYIFSNDSGYTKFVTDSITAGGTTVNDTLMHFMMENLPFGGSGPSGIGSYHGKRSFDCFTIDKAYLTVPTILEPVLKNRYPPFSNMSFKILGLLVFKSLGFSRPSKDQITGTLSGPVKSDARTPSHGNGTMNGKENDAHAANGSSILPQRAVNGASQH